ncbi:MAG: MoaD/ThiS family protein [Burkholderiales bacterium]
MKVQLRFFASLREALGPGEALLLTQPATVGEVRDALIARGGAYAEVLAHGRAVRAALNHSVCADSTTIQSDAELAFFPPVTGG